MDTKPDTALTVRTATPQLAATAYEPQSLSEGYVLAQYLAKSGMLGKDIKSAEQALTVMVAGRELGFTAMQSLRAIYIVEGRVTLSADAMVALVLRSPECEYLALVESTADRCTYKTKRRGQDEVVMSFTEEDRARAKLANVHSTYPALMKRHRCASHICKAVYPDVTLGMLTPDEAREITAPRIIDSEIVPLAPAPEQPAAPSIEQLAAAWESRLRAATSATEGTAIVKEITTAIPDKQDATRLRLAAILDERKAAKWAISEPAHDPITGVVDERQPGEDG